MNISSKGQNDGVAGVSYALYRVPVLLLLMTLQQKLVTKRY